MLFLYGALFAVLAVLWWERRSYWGFNEYGYPVNLWGELVAFWGRLQARLRPPAPAQVVDLSGCIAPLMAHDTPFLRMLEQSAAGEEFVWHEEEDLPDDPR